MKIISKIKLLSIIAAVGMLFVSCESFFDVETDDILDASDNYKERETIYAGLIGVSDVFRSTVEHHIILSELLGDLMQPTTNAPDEAWDVYNFRASQGNSFASPLPYYRLILECNELLTGAVKYRKEFPKSLAENIYNGVISTTVVYRAWAYLQLGKLYGEAVYHDYSFIDDNGIVPGKESLMNLDQLVDELIFNLKVGVDGINGFYKLDWKLIIDPLGSNFDQSWNHIAYDANVLITELYLWDKDYTNAARTALNLLNTTGDKYKLNVFRNIDGNEWNYSKIFNNKSLTDDYFKELITYVPFDFSKQQLSKMQYYFSAKEPNVYYFAPHMNAMMRFSDQVSGIRDDPDPELDGTLERSLDSRRMANIDSEGGYMVINKYHQEKENYRQDGRIYVTRAPEIYLMIAEALSGLENIAAADSLINVGLKPSWREGYFDKPFDAPIYTEVLNSCEGIRGRIKNIKGDYVRYHLDSIAYPDTTNALKELKKKREKYIIDSLICEETALELAYEGKRWFTLMRISRNSENYDLLAKQIAAKFRFGEQEIYERWLMEPSNWFIKWDHFNVSEDQNK